MDLTADKRKTMDKSEFAGPGHSYPINDKNHARLAISGASHAEHVGNISKSEENSIDAKARAKLGEKGGDPKGGDPPAHSDPKAAVAKMHPHHVHKLVQDALSGKHGPEAQKTAQQATQASPGGQPTQSEPSEAQPNYASMFNGGGQDQSDNDDDDQPVSAGQMFGGR